MEAYWITSLALLANYNALPFQQGLGFCKKINFELISLY